MVGRLQALVGARLRAQVAGHDAAERAEVIWGSPGERWFVPDDPVWRVHADASMFPGGLASLLLQMQHPLAMAGVSDHSGFRGDPWGRLQRTSHYLATTTFGTVEQAESAIARVRAVHDWVTGTDRRGRPYSAGDPHLLGWVHVAEVWCFLRAFQAYAARPLSDTEADTYVAQAAVSARLLGVVDPPTTVAGLDAALAAYRPELETTREALAAARFLLLNPPLPLLVRPAYAVVAAGAFRVLPPWARRRFGVVLPPALVPLVLQPLGQAATSTIRWAMAGLEDASDGSAAAEG